jgi:hypothetical protein
VFFEICFLFKVFLQNLFFSFFLHIVLGVFFVICFAFEVFIPNHFLNIVSGVFFEIWFVLEVWFAIIFKVVRTENNFLKILRLLPYIANFPFGIGLCASSCGGGCFFVVIC